MSKIQWTDDTWNPIVGCSKISPGCANCYAAAAAKSARMQQFEQYRAVADWDGTVGFVENQLLKPLSWRQPKRIFVCSMSDLFHPSVPDEWIDSVLAVSVLCPQHTFQVLTKRPERMAKYFAERQGIEGAIAEIVKTLPKRQLEAWSEYVISNDVRLIALPLPNVWLGTTAENQEMANKRIPLLLQAPAAVRFVSFEPLLEEIRLDNLNVQGISWAIVGGESGTGARPCYLEWMRSLVNQCNVLGIPTFVKQLGMRPIDGDGVEVKLRDRKGGDPKEWPEKLRVREFPEVKWYPRSPRR